MNRSQLEATRLEPTWDQHGPSPRFNDDGREALNLRDDPLLAAVPVLCGYKVLGPAALYGSLGRGGMGAVYRARHLELGIDVAVKCLLPGHAALHPSALARFRREAALASDLDHPNVVQVLGAGERGGLHFLVMEYVHGETLQQRVQRRGALPLGEALGIARRAARGLGAAHQRGLVHRDVKPDNLMIGTAGEVKVCDLGLAKLADTPSELTCSAGPMGTPRYMAPEQWSHAKAVDARADVYGLGACLYFLLTGQHGIAAGDLDELHHSVFEQPFPQVRERAPWVPEDVARIIERCVAKDPSERYADCVELTRALQGAAAGRETSLVDSAQGCRPQGGSNGMPEESQERALRVAWGKQPRPPRGRRLAGHLRAGAALRLAIIALAWAAGRACQM